MHKEHFPSWVPNEPGHRPDGYWRTVFGGGLGTIALEVERSQKSFDDYTGSAQFYTDQTKLFRVIWIVRFEGIARLILSAVQKIGGTGAGLHNFIRESDFREKGWSAEIFLGRDVGKSLSHFLPCVRSNPEQYIAPTLILNLMKSPHMSKPYLTLRKKLKSHRVGPSLLASNSSSLPLTHLTKGLPSNEN